jgi:hypothetical protein
MDTHAIDIAVRNDDASWCRCACGWVSPETTEDDAMAMWTQHVVERAFTSPTKY